MKQAVIDVRVVTKTQEAIDICSFELVGANGDALPPFSAGAHVDVEVGQGITRQYSLCNNPAESHRYLIAVLRDPNSRGGSKAIHADIVEGSIIRISEPRNHFSLDRHAKKSLLLAGGIGITPILCMAERLSAIEAEFDLHYCARSSERMAFQKRIKSSNFSHRTYFHFDDGDDEQKLDISKVIDMADDDTHLYVCGPTGFLEFVLSAARSSGWKDDRLHYEYFSAPAIEHVNDTSFDVKLASSGAVVSVPAGVTIIQALMESGIDVPVSCEQGVCGTCLTRVLEGEPEHLDQYLTDAEKVENNQMLLCCSRAKSPLLVLDL